MILKNDNKDTFIQKKKGKRIFLFGAGITLESCLDTYFYDNSITGIVDNEKKLWGTTVEYNDREIPIMGVDQFVREVNADNIYDTIMFITSTTYASEIFEQLNAIEELKELECYMYALLRNKIEISSDFEFSKGIQQIPKIIHYCWFGGKEIPDHLKKYMESWKKFCPDYEIRRWDESNYDVTKNEYMKEAYASKKWGFVSDYARLDIIYNYGGIYLDTDVQLLRSMDCLLNDRAFFGFQCDDIVAIGLGFGAVPKHPVIRKMRDVYNTEHFIKADGSLNLKPCYFYQHPILRQEGFKFNNTYQYINGMVTYPVEVLNSTGMNDIDDYSTSRTISIHHGERSWFTEDEKKSYYNVRDMMFNGI